MEVSGQLYAPVTLHLVKQELVWTPEPDGHGKEKIDPCRSLCGPQSRSGHGKETIDPCCWWE
jgi:hypothetical protein